MYDNEPFRDLTITPEKRCMTLLADFGWSLSTGRDPQAATHHPCARPVSQVGQKDREMTKTLLQFIL